jgi:cytochrome c peroxidase
MTYPPKNATHPRVILLTLACIVIPPAEAVDLTLEPLKPVPTGIPVDHDAAALGHSLFYDRRLSKDQTVSCQSCHQDEHAGADGRPRGVGAHGTTGGINVPTVWNSSLNFKQQWAGGAESTAELIPKIIKNPAVFDNDFATIIARLTSDPVSVATFAATYPDGITEHNIVHALASYTNALTTPGARFDRYLSGDEQAITEREKRGYERFKSYGCVACHQGVNVGGNMFQHFGVMGDYFANRALTPADQGRYNVTQQEADRFRFKVPSLRNVEHTAPYFHDGSAPTLDAALDVMFRYQLGRRPASGDKELIIEFLKTLSARPHNDYLGTP